MTLSAFVQRNRYPPKGLLRNHVFGARVDLEHMGVSFLTIDGLGHLLEQ